MQVSDFNELLKEELDRITNMLGSKRDEYAVETDVLHNFKAAAALQKETPEQALGGMMVKHTVSVYDMIESGEHYTLAQWTEKITDHLNYLILLKAIVVEKQRILDRALEKDVIRFDFNPGSLTQSAEDMTRLINQGLIFRKDLRP